MGKQTQLLTEALEEIIDDNYRYGNFLALTQEEAREYISGKYKRNK